MSNSRIARADKNKMRAHLEELLRLQKELVKRMDDLAQETSVAEYQNFLRELSNHQSDLNRKVYNYMVRKCNR